MKKFLLGWAGFLLMFVAAGFVVGAVKFDGGPMGFVLAAIFALAGWRTWRRAGGSTKPPTGVGG